MNLPRIKTYTSIALLLSSIAMTGCGSSSSDAGTTVSIGTKAYVEQNTELKGDFNEDVTLEAGKAYKITGEVNFRSGTTLTIPAGTTLYGSTPSSYLAINAGAKIDAQGTVDSPIIFTSAEDYNVRSTKDAQGEWGGLTIIGKAPIHGGTKTYEAGTQVGGGNDAADNSGILKYVIIKHTGYEVETDKELNGLSLLAVGSGTEISDIAVIGGADDGIEIWGGTVNLKNIYVYNAADDSLDTDSGYTGTIDNAVAVQKVVDKTNYDSSGIESGNDKDTYDVSPTGDAAPTMPTLKNATLNVIGGAIYIKNDSGYKFENVIVNTKPSTVSGQTDTADQAMVTLRTTDTVDDLSGNPYGITFNGLILNNEVNPELIFAKRTAKDDSNGGNTTDQFFTESYWLNNVDITTANVNYAGPLFVSATKTIDGTAIINEASNKSTAARTAVTGADQSVFDWVLKELNSVTNGVTLTVEAETGTNQM